MMSHDVKLVYDMIFALCLQCQEYREAHRPGFGLEDYCLFLLPPFEGNSSTDFLS